MFQYISKLIYGTWYSSSLCISSKICLLCGPTLFKFAIRIHIRILFHISDYNPIQREMHRTLKTVKSSTVYSATVFWIRIHRIRMFLGLTTDLSQRYGSGSFYYQAKIVRKTLVPTVLWLLYDFLSLKNDVNVPSKSNKQKQIICCWRLEEHCRNSTIRIRIRIRIRNRIH